MSKRMYLALVSLVFAILEMASGHKVHMILGLIAVLIASILFWQERKQSQ